MFNSQKKKAKREQIQRENELKAKMEIKKTLGKMKRQSAKLGKNKEEYIIKAREAKRGGNNVEYNVLRTGIKTVIKRQSIIDVMIAQFESSVMIAEVNEVVGDFVQNTEVLAGLMNQVTKTTDITNAQIAYEKAINSNLGQFEALNIFLEATTDSLESMNDFGDMMDDDEIDKLINNEVNFVENEINDEIDELINQVQKKIKS